jgi:hypothetical protein
MTDALKQFLFAELVQVIDSKLNAGGGECLDKVKKVKESLSTYVQQIAGRIHLESIRTDSLRSHLVHLASQVSSTDTGNHLNNDLAALRSYTEGELNVFQSLIGVVNRKISDLIADTHQDSIKFNSSGFR